MTKKRNGFANLLHRIDTHDALVGRKSVMLWDTPTLLTLSVILWYQWDIISANLDKSMGYGLRTMPNVSSGLKSDYIGHMKSIESSRDSGIREQVLAALALSHLGTDTLEVHRGTMPDLNRAGAHPK